jgi:very-short-patch-repair endonuclease
MNNPNCYRKKLLDYYLNPKVASTTSNTLQDLLNRIDANSGAFQKGVCSFLFANNFGNYITPQFKVGEYKIDFGIVKNKKKIAIELDGYVSNSYEQIRNDIKRQEILERVGWQFFRIQSSEWFYKNKVVSAKLLNWLNEKTA